MYAVTLARALILVAIIGTLTNSLFTQAESKGIGIELVMEILSEYGIPTNQASLLLLAIKPASTADPEDDQISVNLSKTNPRLASRSGNQLEKDSAQLEGAIEFAKTLPPSGDNQHAISLMTKIRDDIKIKLRQRQRENIPATFSMEQERSFRNDQIKEAAKKHFARPLPSPLPHPAPNNDSTAKPYLSPQPQPPPMNGRGEGCFTTSAEGVCITHELRTY